MYRWWETFTPTQGQYLALIDLYTRLHRRPLAETDLQEYFRVSPPLGFIRRQPRTPAASHFSLIPNSSRSYFDRHRGRHRHADGDLRNA
jgi:hypothetical protein